MTGPPGPTVGRQSVALFNLSFAWAIAAFFALSALAHFNVSGPGWQSYQAQLRKNRNPYRWLEYSLSASIMIVLIAMLVGISDIAALVALIGVNGSMIGFGWMQERYERAGAGHEEVGKCREAEEGGDRPGETQVEQDDLLLPDVGSGRPGHVRGPHRQGEAVGQDQDQESL